MDKEHKAIERLKLGAEMSQSYYGKPLVITYSGGKDSECLLELARRSGIEFELHHSHTTADAPVTVYHVRKVFREMELQGIKCNIDYHVNPDYPGGRVTMWNLIPKKLMPPTRTARYCCSALKESGCNNRMIATGVRKFESIKRRERESFEVITSKKDDRIALSDEIMLMTDNGERRRMIEKCEMKAKTVVNPIIDWENSEVIDYFRHECKFQNPIYNQTGLTRCGCIGCPMAGKSRWTEFRIFPKYKQMYIHAFDRMLKEVVRKHGQNQTRWVDAENVFLWWMEDKNIPGQLELEL